MDQAAPGRRRRLHSAEFKAQAVQASQQPGVSMAAVAMAHGINANLLWRWVHEKARPPIAALAVSDKPAAFIELPMPAPSAPPASSADPRGSLAKCQRPRGLSSPSGAGSRRQPDLPARLRLEA